MSLVYDDKEWDLFLELCRDKDPKIAHLAAMMRRIIAEIQLEESIEAFKKKLKKCAPARASRERG